MDELRCRNTIELKWRRDDETLDMDDDDASSMVTMNKQTAPVHRNDVN